MELMMGESVKRVLFVNSEITPYLPETPISLIGRYLPQGIQERKKEIRSFMPRYGCINERKNQLHEVIRLSGMNIIISDVDHPLVIKVASISAARMQVYFIDNEEYFRRKQVAYDEKGNFFADNGDRAIFFARGVLETAKKLRWAPDIIHCHGWITHLLPLYLKKIYKDDPIFANSKVVLFRPFRLPERRRRGPAGRRQWHKTCSNCHPVLGWGHPEYFRYRSRTEKDLQGCRSAGARLQGQIHCGRELYRRVQQFL